jgi:glycosyltransferase involved in cell wall biosynthesis
VASKLEHDWRGGIGRVLAGTAVALAARGHAVHVAGSAPHGEPLPLEDVFLHPWPPRRRKLEQLGPLVRLQREIRADVVHFHSAVPHGIVILPFLALTRHVGAPLVVVTPYTGARSDYPKRLSRAALRRVHGVVTNSEWGARAAVAAGASPERTRVVPAGVDPGCVREDRTASRDLVAMARLVHSKGVDVLLEGFDRAAKGRPAWRLRVAGTGREADALRRQAAALAHGDRVEFVGSVSGEEKERLLVGAGLGVVPSRQDNFPGSLLEFLAHGIPCVASAVGGIPEIAEGGKAAELVPPEDPERLGCALGGLMDAPEARSRLSAAAARAAAAHAWEAVVERLEGIYREFLEVRDRGAGKPFVS